MIFIVVLADEDMNLKKKLWAFLQPHMVRSCSLNLSGTLTPAGLVVHIFVVHWNEFILKTIGLQITFVLPGWVVGLFNYVLKNGLFILS